MSVKVKEESSNKLVLEFDNGDLNKMKDVIEKWGFKDHQSYLRFAVSVFLLNEARYIGIVENGIENHVAPIKDLLKD